MAAARCPPRSDAAHNARNLGREIEVAYPFHPLFRRPAIVVADQLHNGSQHLTLRVGDEPSFLVPAWMADPEVASVEIVEVPRLSIARLLDLRVLLDSVLACGPGKEILGGEADGQVLVECTARFVRRATTGHETRRRRAGESTGATPSAADRGDGGCERSPGDGR